MHDSMGIGPTRKPKTLAHWGLAACLALLCAVAPLQAEEVIKVITNADEANTKVDRDMLRAIYLIRVQHWPDGRPIRVFVLPDDDPLHDRFAREVLATYPYVLRSTWDRIVFTGTGLAPIMVKSEQEMRERVMTTPGAIGYVRKPPDAKAGDPTIGSRGKNEVTP